MDYSYRPPHGKEKTQSVSLRPNSYTKTGYTRGYILVISRDVAEQLGWKIGQKIKIMEGYGNDAGRYMLTRSRDGTSTVHKRTHKSRQRAVAFPAVRAGLDTSRFTGSRLVDVPFEVFNGDSLIVDLSEYKA